MKAILGHFTRRPAIERTYLTLTPPQPTLVFAFRPASRGGVHVLENEPLRATIRAGSR